MKNLQRNWRGSSTLLSVEMSQTLKNGNRQNVWSTPSVKMFVARYLKDDGDSASTFLFVPA